jgi:hypothetical protein
MSEQSPAPRAHTLRFQGSVNHLVRGLLRVPLVCRVMGTRLITILVVGRTTGRTFAVPVAYMRHGDVLLVGTQFSWIRNLQTGVPVQIRLLGKLRFADVQILTDEPDVVGHFAIMARDNHQFARFNQITLDESGEPRSDDLHLAWVSGARVAVLDPR